MSTLNRRLALAAILGSFFAFGAAPSYAKDCCSKPGSACCADKEKCRKCCAPEKNCCADKDACAKCCSAEKK